MALRDPMNVVDVAAVLPLALRIENNFELPTVGEKAIAHYILVRASNWHQYPPKKTLKDGDVAHVVKDIQKFKKS